MANFRDSGLILGKAIKLLLSFQLSFAVLFFRCVMSGIFYINKNVNPVWFRHVFCHNFVTKEIFFVKGWNMGSTEFSIMVHDNNLRSKFVRTAITFLQKIKFDGLGK